MLPGTSSVSGCHLKAWIPSFFGGWCIPWTQDTNCFENLWYGQFAFGLSCYQVSRYLIWTHMVPGQTFPSYAVLVLLCKPGPQLYGKQITNTCGLEFWWVLHFFKTGYIACTGPWAVATIAKAWPVNFHRRRGQRGRCSSMFWRVQLPFTVVVQLKQSLHVVSTYIFLPAAFWGMMYD